MEFVFLSRSESWAECGIRLHCWFLYYVFYILAAPRQNQQYDVRLAKTQMSLGIRPVWSETSLCAQTVAKDPSFPHADSEDSDVAMWMPRLIWVFAGRKDYFVGFVMLRLICLSSVMINLGNRQLVALLCCPSVCVCIFWGLAFFLFYLLVPEEGCDIWYFSRRMTKQTKSPVRQAKTQISLGIRPA